MQTADILGTTQEYFAADLVKVKGKVLVKNPGIAI